MANQPETAPSCPPGALQADVLAERKNRRNPDGTWATGNLGAATDLLRAKTLLDVPELAEAHAEKVRAIEADLGADLSTLKASAVREAARLALIVDSLGHDLLTKGVISPKGKTRAALSAYVLTLDRLTKLQTLLGLERRSRSLPTTVAGIVAGLERE